MKLVFRGHDERYVVEQSLMNLFPGELPVYEPITPGDDSWAVISLEETGDLCRVAVSLCRGGKTTEQTYQEPLSGGDFQREGLRRHAVGVLEPQMQRCQPHRQPRRLHPVIAQLGTVPQQQYRLFQCRQALLQGVQR